MTRNGDREQLYISPREIAERYGLTAKTWRRRISEGRLETVRLGRRILIPISDIHRLLAENTRPAKREQRGTQEQTNA